MTVELDASQKSNFIIYFFDLQKSGNSQGITNGRGTTSMAGSRSSELDPDRPVSRASAHNVEIVITGRTRSRTDLCPDVPRSKFEHAV